MITLACLAVIFAFFAAVTGFNGTAVLSIMVAIMLIVAKCAP